MVSAGARAYNITGVWGQSPRPVGGQGGEAPLKPTRFLCLKH